MNRRMFCAAVFGAASVSLLSGSAIAQGAMSARNVVLVHGAFADGSCWSEVIARLQRTGLNATAVQNPLTPLADDVAATRRILALHPQEITNLILEAAAQSA